MRSILFVGLIVASGTGLISCGEQRVVVDPSSEIALRRGPCGPACPNYAIAVRGDGYVTYHGFADVPIIGERSSRLTSDQVSELFQLFEDIGFDRLDDEYDMRVLDGTEVLLAYRHGASVKQVRSHWVGSKELVIRPEDCPHLTMHMELDRLAQAVDRVTGSDQWIR